MKITITLDTASENFNDLRKFLDEMEKIPVASPGPAVISTFAVESAEEPEAQAAPAEEAQTVSLQDVKAVCLKMSKAGRQAELKTAFAKFGGKKLSDIAEADYPALLKELGDA